MILHKPATSRLFPALDMVPCTMIDFAMIQPPKSAERFGFLSGKYLADSCEAEYSNGFAQD
jgi:hypothetical protein